MSLISASLRYAVLSMLVTAAWSITVHAQDPSGTESARELGCFLDSPTADPDGPEGHDLDGAVFSDPSMTVDSCIALCLDQGFSLAGLQAASRCFCGDSYDKSSNASATCETPCAGDSSQYCGGESATRVYELVKTEAAKIPPGAPSAFDGSVQPQPAIPGIPSELPQTVQRTASVFPVGKWPEGLAWDGSNLWVAESGQRQLARLDPDNGNVRQRVKVGRLPVGLTSTSDGQVYAAVATDKKIWRQPAGGEPGRTLARLQNYPQAIVADEDAVWVLTWVGGSSSQTQVVRIDPATGQRSHSAILPRNGFDLAVTGDIVWVLHRYDGQGLCELIALDKHSLSEMSRAPFDGFASLLAATELGVFAAGGEFGKKGLIVKFDPLTGHELARNDNFGIVSSLAVDNDHVIAVDDHGAIGVLSAHDLSVIRTIQTTFGEFRSQRVLPLRRSLFMTTHRGRGTDGSVIAVDDWRP